MKILLTGASGFLGKSIVQHLKNDYQLITVGRNSSSNIISDLSKCVPKLPLVDLVVHVAGKAHSVPKNQREKEEFFEVNVSGTNNLLIGLKKELPKTIVFISTVAVYGCESGFDIDESHPLEGSSPYAKSKIKAEELLLNWGKLNNVSVVILRLPLISGFNPPGNLKAMAKAIKNGYYFGLGKGEAKKSMVAGSDVAQLIPSLMFKSGIYNLTDGIHPELKTIETKMAQIFRKKIRNLPIWPLKAIAKIGDAFSFFPLNSIRINKLTSTLTFSDNRAREELSWRPKPALSALDFTTSLDE